MKLKMVSRLFERG